MGDYTKLVIPLVHLKEPTADDQKFLDFVGHPSYLPEKTLARFRKDAPSRLEGMFMRSSGLQPRFELTATLSKQRRLDAVAEVKDDGCIAAFMQRFCLMLPGWEEIVAIASAERAGDVTHTIWVSHVDGVKRVNLSDPKEEAVYIHRFRSEQQLSLLP